MEIVVNSEFVERYIKENKRHAAYAETVDIANHLRFHIDGYTAGKSDNPYFVKLIDERRPSESAMIKKYRKEIYLAKTKEPCFKVLNSLKKIVKSEDWKIDFSKSESPKGIKDDERLEVYTEQRYPFFKSVENWLYSFAVKEDLSDPNGIVYIIPISYETEATEYQRPFSYFARSENVYDYVEGKYAVIRTDRTADYFDENGKFAGKENIIIIITDSEIWESRRLNSKGDYETVLKLTHNIKSLPAFRIGGVYDKIIDNTPVYLSFIDPIIPGLDKAAREESDLDAEVVQHIFSTMWYISGQDCKKCNGTGFVKKAGAEQVDCVSCGGHGSFLKSPYSDIVVKSTELDQKQIPTPPAGYIQKNVDIVKIQDERIENHIYRALSAINMEHLASVPSNQSGRAKEFDREESSNYFYGVAYHLVENILKNVYHYINEYRNSIAVPSDIERKKLLPTIPVPERFDMLSENMVAEQLASARTSKADSVIINELEIDYVVKKFNNNPDVRKKLLAIKRLDPFPAQDYNQKSTELLGGTITKKDAVISSYITSFVERAINEHPDEDTGFIAMDRAKQLAIISKYADEKLKEISGAEKIVKAIEDNAA